MAFNIPSAARNSGRLLAAIMVLALIWLVVQGIERIGVAGAPGADVAPPSPKAAAQAVIAGNLFGAGASPVPPAPSATTLGFRLKGVYAPGFAIFSNGNLPDIGVKVGSEVQPGARLQAVYPDYVLIVRGGALERLDLTRSGAAGKAVAPRPPALLATPGSIVLSRSELAPLLADPRQQLGFAQLGAYPGAGIVINDATAGSLASRLGLHHGDVVQKVNDKLIAGKEDLLRIADPSAAGNQISIEVTRNGQPTRFTYSLQP